MVITWPDGKIHRLPFGSTVRDLALASSARSSDRERDTEQKPLDVLNVNNQMVPCATPLQDGDLVIIQ
jgi:molybdopterin converting factor small subunit